MSTPWSRAHERAMAGLTVHTHEQRLRETSMRGRVPIPPGHKDGREIRIRGKTHKSISAAARTLRVHPRQIYLWLREGVAIFVKRNAYGRKFR